MQVDCRIYALYSEYVNDFDQPVIFQCPHGGVLNGVSSYHTTTERIGASDSTAAKVQVLDLIDVNCNENYLLFNC